MTEFEKFFGAFSEVIDELIREYNNLKPHTYRSVDDIRKLRIGDRMSLESCNERTIPLIIVGLVDDDEDGTLYLDYEGNDGDIIEKNIHDVYRSGSWLSVIWKKLFR